MFTAAPRHKAGRSYAPRLQDNLSALVGLRPPLKLTESAVTPWLPCVTAAAPRHKAGRSYAPRLQDNLSALVRALPSLGELDSGTCARRLREGKSGMVTTPQSTTSTAPLTRGAKRNGANLRSPWLPQMRELDSGIYAGRLREGKFIIGTTPQSKQVLTAPYSSRAFHGGGATSPPRSLRMGRRCRNPHCGSPVRT